MYRLCVPKKAQRRDGRFHRTGQIWTSKGWCEQLPSNHFANFWNRINRKKITRELTKNVCSGYDSVRIAKVSCHKLSASRADTVLTRHTILPLSGKPGTRDKALKIKRLLGRLISFLNVLKKADSKTSSDSRAVWSSFGIPKVDRLKSYHHSEELRKIYWMETPVTFQIARYGLWESRTGEYTHSSNNVSLVSCKINQLSQYVVGSLLKIFRFSVTFLVKH